MMSWLNTSASALQAVGTIAIAVLTWLYICYTKRLLDQAKKSAYDQKMPVVVFRFRHSQGKGGGPVTEERLVNIGTGPALHLTLYSNVDVKDGAIVGINKGAKLEKWPLPVDNVLGPEIGDAHMQICFLTTEGADRSILRNPDLVLRVLYQDVFGRKYATNFENLKNDFHLGKDSKMDKESAWQEYTRKANNFGDWFTAIIISVFVYLIGFSDKKANACLWKGSFIAAVVALMLVFLHKIFGVWAAKMRVDEGQSKLEHNIENVREWIFKSLVILGVLSVIFSGIILVRDLFKQF